MLTKSQRVRQYQLDRFTNYGEDRTHFDKYSPDQPRDERGRWTAAGVAAGLLAGAALGAGGVMLARNPGALRQGFNAARNRLGFGTASKVPKVPTAAAAPRDTKPYASLSPRQQRRRETTVRSKLMERGASKEQADAAIARMRESASIKPGPGGRDLTVAGVAKPPAVQAPSVTMPPAEFYRAELARHTAELHTAERATASARQRLGEFQAVHGRMGNPNFESRATQAQRKSLEDALKITQVRENNAALNLKTTQARVKGTKKRAAVTLFDSAVSQRLAKYSPDQQRDQDGQWADEGKGRGSGGSGSRSRKPSADTLPPATTVAEPSAFGSDKWALARELGINAALIGATIYGGPAVSAAGRSTMAGGRRVGRVLSDTYNRLRSRIRRPGA